ncbi:MAG: bifunctional oligoribonuclease/PAP phosphatase NrnA [Bacilli bacterium]
MKKKLETEILDVASKYKSEYSKIIKAIKRYDRIAIFRHIMPDYDALGSQLGLESWIKDNFPEKEVICLGDNHVTFTPRLFREMDRVNDEWFKKPFLAIIVDVGNTSRIADPRFKKARYKIKIDHHPEVEKFVSVSVVNTSMASASELITNILLSVKGDYKLSEETCKNLYIALVGDSGRFMYSSTSSHTFAIAKHLVDSGINLPKIYQQMYVKELDDLKVTGYILENFRVSPHGVAYYVLNNDDLVRLKITTERGKENVNLFSNINGINAWCSITEDVKDSCYRISIRSKEKAINEVATRFGGGGHAQASGAKIDSLNELDYFIGELDKLFVE